MTDMKITNTLVLSSNNFILFALDIAYWVVKKLLIY